MESSSISPQPDPRWADATSAGPTRSARWRRGGRRQWAPRPGAVMLAVVLVAGLGLTGWTLLRPTAGAAGPARDALARTSAPAPVSPSAPSPVPATAGPSPTRTPTSRATSTVRPRPTPSRKPPAVQLPPPPPPPTSNAPGCTQHPGPDAPFAEVSAALVAAGAQEYWQGTQRPADLVGELPTITVPPALMKAIAWQESGWQSTIIACDGGIGTMQVMPGTAEFVNNRFGRSFDVHTLDGNTSLGAAYLEWLTMYFGLYYFGAFDLAATADIGTGGVTLRLRDVVVAAYNVGPHALEDLHGTEDGADDTLSIPNQGYVNNVVALMTTCPCQSY